MATNMCDLQHKQASFFALICICQFPVLATHTALLPLSPLGDQVHGLSLLAPSYSWLGSTLAGHTSLSPGWQKAGENLALGAQDAHLLISGIPS